MKNSYYFDHDYNARNDQKILELRAEFGWEGYGVYFALLESLCESNGEVKRGALGGLSLGLNLAKPELIKMIEFMLSIGLLHEENGVIFSERIKKHLAFRAFLSASGKSGGRGNKKPPFTPPKAPPEAGKKSKEEKDSIDININNISSTTTEEKSDTPVLKTWRESFDVYLAECKYEFNRLYNDESFIKKQQLFNPNVNIRKSMFKAYDNFWGTEAGWKHKKKAKAKETNWQQTIANALSLPSNKVYLTKEELANQ